MGKLVAREGTLAKRTGRFNRPGFHQEEILGVMGVIGVSEKYRDFVNDGGKYLDFIHHGGKIPGFCQ